VISIGGPKAVEKTGKKTPLEIKKRFPLFAQLQQQQSSDLTIPITFCKLLRPASLRSED
jgi:hypothetical protein